MDFQVVVGIVVGLMMIGGIGWKLHAELSKISTMIETFMAIANQKWLQLEKLERGAEKLEEKVIKNTSDIAVIRSRYDQTHG